MNRLENKNRKTDTWWSPAKILALALLGVLSGFGLAKQFKNTSPGLLPAHHQRLPSSVNATWQGKHQRILETKILIKQALPKNDEQEVMLSGQVHALIPLTGEVHYKWILPEGVSVVAGELEDSVVGMPDPQKYKDLTLTVQGFSAEGENKSIILQAYTDIDGLKIGNSTVFSTKPDEVVGLASGLAEQKDGLSAKENTAQKLPKSVQQ